MPRWLYIRLLRLHPAPFRQRFGDEMLEMFENANGLRASALFLADGLLSLIRQWILRPEFRRPLPAPVISDALSGVPLFHSMDPYKPRSAALFQGVFLTLVLLGAVVGLIGQRGTLRRLLIGVHHPSPHLFSVDRASVVESDLNTTVKISPVPEDPWRAIATVYFQQIRVLDALDADHDLNISPWEIITAPAALRRLDSNRDGKLSPAECGFFVGANASIPPDVLERLRRQFIRVNPVLAALDADNDGTISESEMTNSSSALKKLDRNGDGNLTPDELLPDQESVQAAIIFMRLDSNGDGRISKAERAAENAGPLREVLESADGNHDGVTTEDELIRELRLRAETKRLFEGAQKASGLR